jgi:hypothetical protein
VLRVLGFKCLIKVDDLIAVHPAKIETAMMEAYVITQVLIKLGAVVSGEKCDLGLRHRVLWHGMVFCSVVEVCSVPAEKVTKVAQVVQMFQRLLTDPNGVVTARSIQQVLGLLISNLEAVELTRVMVIELQELRRAVTAKDGWNWAANGDEEVPVAKLEMKVVEAARVSCDSWVNGYSSTEPERIARNGKLSYSEPPTAVIYTDACPWQAGAYASEDTINGHPKLEKSIPFADEEIAEHITLQETAAAVDGVLEVLIERRYRNCVILVKIDATAAVKYIHCHGGRIVKFGRRVEVLVQYCRDHHIMLIAGHIKGKLNVSDWQSRKLLGVAEYRLERSLFEALNQMWGPFGLDACAAKWNNQLPRYLSRQVGDSAAIGNDILMHQMQHETQTMWIFPPPHHRMIMEIVQRLQAAQAEAVMVLPAWPTAALGEAVAMLVEMPLLLECKAGLMQPPLAYLLHEKTEGQGTQWYDQRQWSAFVAMRLSGKGSCRGVLAKNWQQSRSVCTKSEPTDAEVSTMMSRSHSLWPGSLRSAEPARLILRMLSYVT